MILTIVIVLSIEPCTSVARRFGRNDDFSIDVP